MSSIGSMLFPVPNPFRPNRTTHQQSISTPTPPTRPTGTYRATLPRTNATTPYSTHAKRVVVAMNPGPAMPLPGNRPTPLLASTARAATTNTPIAPGRQTAFQDYTGKSMGSESGHFARVKGFTS